MSGFLAAVLGYREFLPADQVRIATAIARRKARAEKRYGPSAGADAGGDEHDIRLMLLFATPTQRSWLAVDKLSAYYVLDDLRREEPQVQWLANRSELHPVRANHDHSPASGILHLGKRGTDWLYSKDLFQDRDIVAAIQQFAGAGDP